MTYKYTIEMWNKNGGKTVTETNSEAEMMELGDLPFQKDSLVAYTRVTVNE